MESQVCQDQLDQQDKLDHRGQMDLLGQLEFKVDWVTQVMLVQMVWQALLVL